MLRCFAHVVIFVLAFLGEAIAQTGADGIPREWVLRGVVISEGGRSAVFEQISSGRQERVAIGATVAPGVTVVAIDPDGVVLDGETGTTVTLRLGHGGQGHAVRRPPPMVRPVPTFRRVPRSVLRQ